MHVYLDMKNNVDSAKSNVRCTVVGPPLGSSMLPFNRQNVNRLSI